MDDVCEFVELNKLCIGPWLFLMKLNVFDIVWNHAAQLTDFHLRVKAHYHRPNPPGHDEIRDDALKSVIQVIASSDRSNTCMWKQGASKKHYCFEVGLIDVTHCVVEVIESCFAVLLGLDQVLLGFFWAHKPAHVQCTEGKRGLKKIGVFECNLYQGSFEHIFGISMGCKSFGSGSHVVAILLVSSGSLVS